MESLRLSFSLAQGSDEGRGPVPFSWPPFFDDTNVYSCYYILGEGGKLFSKFQHSLDWNSLAISIQNVLFIA